MPKNFKFVQVVVLDERNFIRTYAEYDLNIEAYEHEMNNFIEKQLKEKEVVKIEIKKWKH